MQNGPIWWASIHRRHHKHSDEVGDLHSPVQRGFWYAHIGWVFDRDLPLPRDESNVRDLAVFHATLLINSLAHVWGTRRYATGDGSRRRCAPAERLRPCAAAASVLRTAADELQRPRQTAPSDQDDRATARVDA